MRGNGVRLPSREGRRREVVRARVCGALACAALLMGSLGAAQAQQDRGYPAMSGLVVQGAGEVRVKPDIARLDLGVQTQNADSTKAAQENAARTDAVVKAIRATGVAESDIQTSGYSIFPQYENQPGKNPTITGYQVSNTVRVTVRKIGDTGKAIDAATKAGANFGGGISFDVNDADKQKALDEALAKAVADARRKATTLAKAAGVSDITLVSIEEGSGSPIRPPYPVARMEMAKADVETPISPGEQSLTASVTLRYAFTPTKL
jgi:uncharacterized protein YggE